MVCAVCSEDMLDPVLFGSFPHDPLHRGMPGFPGICYKSMSKHYTIAIPIALLRFRKSECCYNPLETPPMTNFSPKHMPNNPIAASHGQFSCKNIFMMEIEICEEQEQMTCPFVLRFLL